LPDEVDDVLMFGVHEEPTELLIGALSQEMSMTRSMMASSHYCKVLATRRYLRTIS
jgi:hypothetical protein